MWEGGRRQPLDMAVRVILGGGQALPTARPSASKPPQLRPGKLGFPMT